MRPWVKAITSRRLPQTPPVAATQATEPDHAAPVDALLTSPFFDASWYAATAGCGKGPRAAARHYLRHGRARGLSPHPLFVPDVAVASCPSLAEAADPLLGYLEGRLFTAVTHPLFDVLSYAERHPASRLHPWGPLGHYLADGSRLGLAPNDWYQPRDDQPRGLVDWVVAQQQDWAARFRGQPRSRTRRPPPPAPPAPPLPPESRVGVVVEALEDRAALVRTVGSVLDQDLPPLDVVVAACSDAAATQRVLDDAFGAGAVPVVEAARPAAALDLAAHRSAGDYLAWALAGEVWPVQRLRRLQHAAATDGAAAVADTLLLRRAGRPDSYASAVLPPGRPVSGVVVETSRLLVSRECFTRLGGYDQSLPGGWEADLSIRLTSRVPVVWLDVVGATRELVPSVRGASQHLDRVAAWTPSVFNRHVVDWQALSDREQQSDVVSVVVAGGDWRQARRCVARLHAAEVAGDRTLECLVVDDGSDVLGSQVLSSLEHRFPEVTVVRTACGGWGGVNRALDHASGSVVVLLASDIRVQPGWLGPLLAGLEQPEVLGVQALVTEPSGAVHSAGFAFPEAGGAPYDFLQGFPADDAESLATVPLAAVSGSALALRFVDLVGVRGLDPLFGSGLADADLCLRLTQRRSGGFLVAPASRVTQVRPRRNRSSTVSTLDRALFTDRWSGREPRDDTRLWAGCGFERTGFDPQTWQPVLRRPALRIDEAAPRLRWALKVASPAGDRREFWGDTHFARSLARALRTLHQHVVIDHREGFLRPSSHHDDVTLVLRGLQAFTPDPSQVNLAWVISHPELFTAREAADFDQVFAASRSWAAETSHRWGIDVEPLLQATDPGLFHPDRGRPDAGEPVLFVGGSRRQFRPMVRHSVASGVPVSVFGSDWEEFIPAHHIRATFVPNDDLGALYASAGVVLNDHWEDMRREGFLSNRLFDAVASGARVITDDVAGLEGVFGGSVQVAADAPALVRLVRQDPLDAAFGSVEERRATAARVHREHSFEQRARRLLDVALLAHRRREEDGGH